MSHYHIKTQEEYKAAYQNSIERPEEFWTGIAGNYQWMKPWGTFLEWEFITPSMTWFKGGKLNITENCLDRHLKDRSNDIALIRSLIIQKKRKFV